MEAVEYIYTSNKFRHSTVTAFWCFRRLISNAKFDLIQNLHLQYPYRQGHDYVHGLIEGTPPYNQDCWNKTWGDISKMKNLKRVTVDLFVYAMAMHAGHEEIFFSPLEGLRDDVDIEVRVTWAEDASVQWAKTWPFTVKRRMAHHDEGDGSFRLEGEWEEH
jgi:hypothetical protein